jgi:hypothetical protein
MTKTLTWGANDMSRDAKLVQPPAIGINFYLNNGG